MDASEVMSLKVKFESWADYVIKHITGHPW